MLPVYSTSGRITATPTPNSKSDSNVSKDQPLSGIRSNQVMAILRLRRWAVESKALKCGRTSRLTHAGWRERREIDADARNVREIDFDLALSTLDTAACARWPTCSRRPPPGRDPRPPRPTMRYFRVAGHSGARRPATGSPLLILTHLSGSWVLTTSSHRYSHEFPDGSKHPEHRVQVRDTDWNENQSWNPLGGPRDEQN